MEESEAAAGPKLQQQEAPLQKLRYCVPKPDLGTKVQAGLAKTEQEEGASAEGGLELRTAVKLQGELALAAKLGTVGEMMAMISVGRETARKGDLRVPHGLPGKGTTGEEERRAGRLILLNGCQLAWGYVRTGVWTMLVDGTE